MNEGERLTLQDSDLCRGLNPAEVAKLAALAQPRDYKAGEHVLRQGHPADAVYLPCSGCLMVERSSAGGQRQVLSFLQRGYYLGFTSSPHFLYSAVVLRQSHLLRFSAEPFYALAAEIPALKDNVSRINNQVLGRVIDHLFAIGQKRAHARLAFLLWQLWVHGDDEQALLHLPMRRADIGDYLGLTLETTSRAFSRLRRDGVIETPSNSTVRVLDSKTLQTLADVK